MKYNDSGCVVPPLKILVSSICSIVFRPAHISRNAALAGHTMRLRASLRVRLRLCVALQRMFFAVFSGNALDRP